MREGSRATEQAAETGAQTVVDQILRHSRAYPETPHLCPRCREPVAGRALEEHYRRHEGDAQRDEASAERMMAL